MMITYSGLQFDPKNPKPEQISILDISVALSRIPRFVGHTDKFFSVAHHSLACLDILDSAKTHLTISPKFRLSLLLHDSAEAYISDIPTPVKDLLRPNIDKIENKILKAIYDSIGIALPTKDEKAFQKQIDNLCFLHEDNVRKNIKAISEGDDIIKKYYNYSSSEIALLFQKEVVKLCRLL